MRQFLKMFSGQRPAASHQQPLLENVLHPDTPFYAIGDIHGRVDLLQSLLSKIDPDAQDQLVFLGDYIDRGADSAATLTMLYELYQNRPEKVVCLMGNHEKMMCDFIDDPLDRGARWLRNGGRETLASFAIDLPKSPSPEQTLAACDALETALGLPISAWLRTLPLSWNSGNIWCVHAAMNPATSPDKQKSATMLWGHRAFLERARQDGMVVMHGHTITDRPLNANSRIAVDTGAYKTGKLTAAHVTNQQCEFIYT